LALDERAIGRGSADRVVRRLDQCPNGVGRAVHGERAEALRALAVEHQAETSWLGVGLSAGSLLICPGLGVVKRRMGTGSAPPPPAAKASRTSPAPASPSASSPDCSATPCPDSGGSTPRSRSSSPPPSRAASRPGRAATAKAAASQRPPQRRRISDPRVARSACHCQTPAVSSVSKRLSELRRPTPHGCVF
jgi:hypothetical protein